MFFDLVIADLRGQSANSSSSADVMWSESYLIAKRLRPKPQVHLSEGIENHQNEL